MDQVDSLMQQVSWEPVRHDKQYAPGERYATHSGVLELMGMRLRCYRLNTGEAVFDADDIANFLGGSFEI